MDRLAGASTPCAEWLLWFGREALCTAHGAQRRALSRAPRRNSDDALVEAKCGQVREGIRVTTCSRASPRGALRYVVEPRGFEPLTSSVRGMRSPS